MTRKLPVYIVIDTSFSMRGKPIEQINAGLKELIKSLKREPGFLEVLYLSVVVYSTKAKQILPLTPLYNVVVPEIKAGGRSNMGAAFSLLKDRLEKEIKFGDIKKEEKGDFRPIIYLLTDGAPSDSWKNRLKALNETCKPRIVSFGTSNANMDVLETISGEQTVDLNMFEDGIDTFLELVSQSIGYCSTSHVDFDVHSTDGLPPFENAYNKDDELF